MAIEGFRAGYFLWDKGSEDGEVITNPQGRLLTGV